MLPMAHFELTREKKEILTFEQTCQKQTPPPPTQTNTPHICVCVCGGGGGGGELMPLFAFAPPPICQWYTCSLFDITTELRNVQWFACVLKG